MYKIHLSADAEEDLTGIWLHTLQEWGIEQADHYLDELQARFSHLAAHPNLGRAREALRPGYFSLPVNQHIAYYTVSGTTIRIIRVLHSRMDPQLNLR